MWVPPWQETWYCHRLMISTGYKQVPKSLGIRLKPHQSVLTNTEHAEPCSLMEAAGKLSSGFQKVKRKEDGPRKMSILILESVTTRATFPGDLCPGSPLAART